MNINDIAERAHDHAVKCGFYGECASLNIALKSKEESEELQNSLAHERYCDIETFERQFGKSDIAFPKVYTDSFDGMIKNSIGDEMADNILMILAGALELDIDIEKHLYYKQKYNELREDHK